MQPGGTTAQPSAAIHMPNTFEAYGSGGEDMRVYAPSTGRNKGVIGAMLKERLEAAGGAGSRPCPVILEVACGAGEHAANLGSLMPWLTVQPTDYHGDLFGSVAAHAAQLPNVAPPLLLDTSSDARAPGGQWAAAVRAAVTAAMHGGMAQPAPLSSEGELPPPPGGVLDAMLCINMTHISPWPATLGLLDGAANYLVPVTGTLLIYGPFTIDNGTHTSEGNASFDASLRERDPAWGYRDVEAIRGEAAKRGLVLQSP
ncbi:hypothetical protein FOA52_001325 [Chlamydomonas sp. UWO 241]|nr:hypothetical protein FOA52_001325 [Chlamydomonas sp. UWO 241]